MTKIMAPLAPIGWPRAIAPPLTFILAGSSQRSFITASAWVEKASFTSIKSKSSILSDVFCRRITVLLQTESNIYSQ